jgi:hypothetical protein
LEADLAGPKPAGTPPLPDQLSTTYQPIRFVLLAVAVLLCLLNLWHLGIQTSNPDETSNPESLFILHALDLSEGKQLYSDFRRPPFNVTQYTPLHYAFLAALKRTFDLELQQLFSWGRRLTLACTMGIALLVFLYGQKQTENRIFSLTAALLFLGSYMLWPLACTNRSDIPGALFSVAGIVVFATGKKKSLYPAVLLLVLSFYTKQSYLSAPAAVSAYLLINRQFSRAIQFCLSYATLVGLIWFSLHSATDGMSTLNLVSANIAPMKLQNIRLVAGLFLQTAALPMILSFSALSRKWRNDPISIYFIVSLLWALITSAKIGSSANYFVESLAAGCLLIPAFLKRNIESAGVPRAILPALFIVLALPQINFLVHTLNTLQFHHNESARKLASEAKGFVISDNPRIALASRRPFLVDPYAYSYLETGGHWDSSELVSMIKSGKIQYLILLSPLDRPLTWQGVTRLPPGIIKACSEEFKKAGLIDNYSVYVRKKALFQ